MPHSLYSHIEAAFITGAHHSSVHFCRTLCRTRGDRVCALFHSEKSLSLQGLSLRGSTVIGDSLSAIFSINIRDGNQERKLAIVFIAFTISSIASCIPSP